MDKIGNFKAIIVTIFGAIGGVIVELLGGWSTDLQTLIIFMTIDFITGLLVAGVFNNSTKTENGALNSNTGFKGLCKKGVILLIVLICNRLDIAIGVNYIRTAAIIGFILNEAISITENAGLMGIWLPPIVKKSIEILKQKNESEDK